MASGRQPSFYQNRFGPAVMLACGFGFVDPGVALEPGIDVQRPLSVEPRLVPDLIDFLEVKRDTFSCDSLPTDLPTQDPYLFQYGHRYLQSVVALNWAITGISWSSLAPLFGFFYGATIAIAYTIFRLGLGRILSITGGLLLAISAFHLTHLPLLRDYSKAPFILALILIMSYMIASPVNPKLLLGLSTLYGAVLGIGLGFRTDLLINVLPFIIVLFFLLPGPLLSNLKLKTTALILFIGALSIITWPLTLTSDTTSLWHVVLLGFMPLFDTKLDIANSLYQWGHLYSDAYVSTIIGGYAFDIYGEPGVALAIDGYDQYAFQYFLEFARTFPADILIRVYASILKILELPFNTTYLYVPPGIEDHYLADFYQWRTDTLKPIFTINIGILMAVATLLIVSTRNLRIGIYLTLCLLYFAGIPAIQFHERHFFYLEFIGLWALGFVIQELIYLVRNLIQPKTRQTYIHTLTHPQQWWNPATKRLLGFIGGVTTIIIIPLFLIRQYQQEYVGNLINIYLQADRERLALDVTAVGEGRVLVGPSQSDRLFNQSKDMADLLVQTEYLVAEFQPETCGFGAIQAIIRYQSDVEGSINTSMDFSHPVTLDLTSSSQAPNQLFFAAYRTKSSAFIGVELPSAQASCLVGLYRIKDLSHYPLLLTLSISPDWAQMTRYQQIKTTPLDNLLLALSSGPEYILDQEIGGWTLQGYDVNEATLIAGNSVDLKLYWLAPPDINLASSPDFYRQAAHRWIQEIHQVKNLVPDGGFEHSPDFANFPIDIYGANPETRAIVETSRDNISTKVAVLQNTQTYSRTSFASQPIQVQPNNFYLQSGWLESKRGHVFIGRRWLPAKNYDYAIAGVKSVAWSHYAQVIRPDINTEALQIWLLNVRSTGQVSFDNVILIELVPNINVCYSPEMRRTPLCKFLNLSTSVVAPEN